MLLRKKSQNILLSQFKNQVKIAYLKANIPKLNDLSETLLDLISESQSFRIKNRHLEPQPLYVEIDQYLNLYSQVLKLVAKLEFRGKN